MNPQGPASAVRILGIETSCDETAIGIVENGQQILANAVASSLALHQPYGGVIPEIAARAHVETLWEVLAEALGEAHCSPAQIDAIAVTQGPGLPGALLIGMAFAKGLALSLDRPLIPVDHLAAHLYAGEMSEGVKPPYIGLVVSGGHTLLCVAHEGCQFEVLGETRDDAVGETFDKVAKLLGLGYPGGPVIDRLSEEGRAKAVTLPRAGSKQPFDFSFSGLKTAVYHAVERARRPSARHSPLGGSGERLDRLIGARSEQARSLPVRSPALDGNLAPEHGAPSAGTLSRQEIADIAASFQEAAVDVLVTKTLRACLRTGLHQVVVGGGVASNRRLRTRMAEAAQSKKLRVVFPPPALCVDNGAMVAGLGHPLLLKGHVAPLSVNADSNLRLA